MAFARFLLYVQLQNIVRTIHQVPDHQTVLSFLILDNLRYNVFIIFSRLLLIFEMLVTQDLLDRNIHIPYFLAHHSQLVSIIDI